VTGEVALLHLTRIKFSCCFRFGALAHVVDIPLTLATGAVLCAIAAAVTLTVVLANEMETRCQ
jgi:hypothetical protein